MLLFFLVVNLGEQRKHFLGGSSRRTGEGLSEAKLFQVVLATTGYSHNSLKNTSRLGSLEAVGYHHTIGDGSLAVLQAAV